MDASKNFSQTATLVTSALEKPVLDDRNYRVITLPNKLEALLIHDAEIDHSSAALDVNVGSFADPRHLCGLAHFCEHLLFMGTKKYPSENEYSKYLSEHSGHYNAYTASDETNYYFEISHEYLEEALDRFSQFFISPLFSPDCKDREIKAVDSENKKNLQNDTWRLHQLDRSLANKDHPYNKFSTGNLTTLDADPKQQGINVRDELLKFYDASYSANLMKLVVIGRESLDILQEWVTSKFSAVRNIDRPPPQYDGLPLTSNELKKIIRAVPIKNSRDLTVTFQVPDQYANYSSKPCVYYSHLIGHEGPGSLLHFLKEKELATELSAGCDHVVHGTDFFIIDIELTEKGLAEYEQILINIFQYLKMVEKTGPQKWIFEEMKDISVANFKFMPKSGASKTTSHLSSVMQRPYLPRERLLSVSLVRDFDPRQIEQFGTFLVPDNFRVNLTSQSFQGTLDHKEKWYGTEYSVTDISSELLEKLRNVDSNPELHIPSKNEFIATDFEVKKKEVSQPLKHPYLIKYNSQTKVWYKKDDTFWSPKGEVHISLKNPLSQSTPANTVKSFIFSEIISDQLVDFAYDAEVAGLSYDVSVLRSGFEIAISGYNHKLLILLERILKKIMTLEMNPGRFQVLKERVLRTYKNFGFGVPFREISLHGFFLLNENSWDVEDKIKELEALELDDLKAIIPALLRQFQVEILGIGNLSKEDVLKVYDLVTEIIHPSDLGQSQKVEGRSIWLPKGSTYYYNIDVKDKQNINSCIDYFLQVSRIADRRARTTVEILAQIGSERAFNQLRTKEQLGYVVFSGTKTTRTTIGYRVLIQSERTTDYLEKRIDNFLILLGNFLKSMSQEEYQDNVEALISKKLEKKKNLREEASRYWSHITSGYYDFLRHEEDVELMRTIDKQEVIEIFEQYISPQSKCRAKLVVSLRSQSPPDQSQEQMLGAAFINVALNRSINFEASEIQAFTEQCKDKNLDEIFNCLLPESLANKEMSPEEVEQFSHDMNTELELQLNREKPHVPEGIEIEDISIFKSQMSLTEAPTPVVNLSAFTEYEPKL